MACIAVALCSGYALAIRSKAVTVVETNWSGIAQSTLTSDWRYISFKTAHHPKRDIGRSQCMARHEGYQPELERCHRHGHEGD